MKRLPFLIGCLLWLSCDASQRAPMEQATRSIQRQRIDQHGNYLASDRLGGRHFATAESESAAVYLAQQLADAGIPAVTQADELFGPQPRHFIHTFGTTLYRLGPRNKLGMLSRQDQQTLRLGDQFLPLLHSRNARVTGRLVVLNTPAAVAKSSGKLRGRVVLMGPGALHTEVGEAPEETLYRTARLLEARGAVAVLFAGLDDWHRLRTTRYVSHLPPDEIELARSPRGQRLNLHPDRLVLETQTEAWRLAPTATIPAVVLSPGAWRNWRTGAEVGIVLDLQQEVSLGQSVLVGFGTPKRQHDVILLVAHRDHAGVNAAGDILNGADDNASGVAALLETSGALAQVSTTFRRPVLVAFVSGELHGLQGTETLLRDFTMLFGNRRIRCALVLDAIGRNGSDRIVVHSTSASSNQQRALQTHNSRSSLFAAALLLEMVARPPLETSRHTPRQHQTSHELLEWAGIPSMLFNDGLDPYLYGQPEDDWKRIDSRKVARLARLLFRMTSDLAQQSETTTMPARKP